MIMSCIRKIKSIRSLESTKKKKEEDSLYKDSLYKLEVFSLVLGVFVPVRQISAMKVLNYYFLTPIAPIKMWIVLECGYIPSA